MGNFDHGTTYMRVGGDDGELRPLHYMYVYSNESRLGASPLPPFDPCRLVSPTFTRRCRGTSLIRNSPHP